MLATPRRALLLLLAVSVPMVACDTTKEPNAQVAAAPAPQLAPFQQEIKSANAEVTLPGVWRYGYRVVDKADTTNGAFRAIEFHYPGDSAAKVPPRILLVIRAYKKAAWDKAKVKQAGVATVMAEHAGDVYAFSNVTTNPYPLNTPAALRVEAMMLALIGEGTPFRITFR